MKNVAALSSSQYHGVGRRKASVARVWLKPGKGSIIVNGKKHNSYFDTDMNRRFVEQPLQLTNTTSSYDIIANVQGGGVVAQAGAIRLGIARALVEANENMRPILKQHKFLTVDARVKERKKYGQKSARAKFQFVKR